MQQSQNHASSSQEPNPSFLTLKHGTKSNSGEIQRHLLSLIRAGSASQLPYNAQQPGSVLCAGWTQGTGSSEENQELLVKFKSPPWLLRNKLSCQNWQHDRPQKAPGADKLPPVLQAVAESDEVSPQPPFLQAEQPQVPQPLPISLVLQTLPQLRCPSLDTLQPLNVSLGVRSPTLNTVFKPLFPKPVALHGVAVAQVQDLTLSLVEPHTIGPSPWIQPVQVPLQSLPPLQQINTPAQLGVICKLTEGALDPLVQIVDKDIKQNWPQHRTLGNTTCDRPPTGVNSIHHHSLGPAIQPVLYPAKSTTVQAMSSQFLQENAVGNRVKGFTEVQIDNIHSLSLIHQAGHLVVEGDQVGQAGPAFPEPMLAGLDPLVIFYMPCDGTQDDLLHQLSWYRGQGDGL
ncbi:hypothetical protein QYF61_023630 [Mycteria americana]|uniref:Uncharacterized protein n=1 Tax=Mycteria americana TaxID=33587 RepID=A0AAN7RKL9_MYCAM|nr:hypothetical protein QYF61_023630 [Mycteria americana]